MNTFQANNKDMCRAVLQVCGGIYFVSHVSVTAPDVLSVPVSLQLKTTWERRGRISAANSSFGLSE